MIIKEYGTEHKETIILLHGGGLSWWNYRDVADFLQDEYHVILPILDGHAGSDRSFTSIEENVSEIIEFIDKDLGGSVLLIGGLSLGGQILLSFGILPGCLIIINPAPEKKQGRILNSAFENSIISPKLL